MADAANTYMTKADLGSTNKLTNYNKAMTTDVRYAAGCSSQARYIFQEEIFFMFVAVFKNMYMHLHFVRLNLYVLHVIQNSITVCILYGKRHAYM